MSRRPWGSPGPRVNDHGGCPRVIAPADRPLGLGLAPVDVLATARISCPRCRPIQLPDRGVPLAYFRHTNKWFTVHRGLTAAGCFREIEKTRSSGRTGEPLEQQRRVGAHLAPPLDDGVEPLEGNVHPGGGVNLRDAQRLETLFQQHLPGVRRRATGRQHGWTSVVVGAADVVGVVAVESEHHAILVVDADGVIPSQIPHEGRLASSVVVVHTLRHGRVVRRENARDK